MVRLYLLRWVAHEENRYCVYACPFPGSEIDGQTLEAIASQVAGLDIGTIRYDSVMAAGNYFMLDGAGNHVVRDDDYYTGVEAVSDCFDGVVLFSDAVMSASKVRQLDSHYAIVGMDRKLDQYSIVRIPNCVIGEETGSLTFEAEEGAADVEEPQVTERLRQALMTLSAIITIGLLIWYYLISGS